MSTKSCEDDVELKNVEETDNKETDSTEKGDTPDVEPLTVTPGNDEPHVSKDTYNNMDAPETIDDTPPEPRISLVPASPPPFYQTRAILLKNATLQKRNKCSLCCITLLPVILVLLVGVLKIIVEAAIASQTELGAAMQAMQADMREQEEMDLFFENVERCVNDSVDSYRNDCNQMAKPECTPDPMSMSDHCYECGWAQRSEFNETCFTKTALEREQQEERNEIREGRFESSRNSLRFDPFSSNRVFYINPQMSDLVGFFTRDDQSASGILRRLGETIEGLLTVQRIQSQPCMCVEDGRCLSERNDVPNTAQPTPSQTMAPSWAPTQTPTVLPSVSPSASPSQAPSPAPSRAPTNAPHAPSEAPTTAPTVPPPAPTALPTLQPTALPTKVPTSMPSSEPTRSPTRSPTRAPTNAPSMSPTPPPTAAPTYQPFARNFWFYEETSIEEAFPYLQNLVRIRESLPRDVDPRCLELDDDEILPVFGVEFTELQKADNDTFKYSVRWFLPESDRGNKYDTFDAIDLLVRDAAYDVLSVRLQNQAPKKTYRLDGRFPFIEEEESLFSFQIDLFMAPFFFPFALSFLLPVYVSMIVQEKQLKLRAMMQSMGLNMGAYWINQWLYDLILWLFTMAIFYVLNFAFSLTMFTDTVADVSILLMLGWGVSQIGLAFVFSSFFSKTRTANVTLYLLVLATIITSYALNIILWSYDRTNDVFQSPPIYYFLYPPLAFYRGLNLMSNQCQSAAGCATSLASHAEWLYIMVVLYASGILLPLIGVYLDAVLPSEFGVRRSPCFCFLMCCKRKRSDGYAALDIAEVEVGNGHVVDEDVVKERERVEKGTVDNAMVIIKNLRKVYPGGKVAVQKLTMAIEDGETFGLLGPNGAGKSTTLGMLTGLFPASSGEAWVNDYKISTEMHEIHRCIGLCPQFDTLWLDLTVRETLLFYLRLKGIYGANSKKGVEAAMKEIGLAEAANKRISELSGGMRRRVSIAVSLCGNPKLVVLDEPSSGLDAVTRRELWDVLLRAAVGRCMIITSHAMEEVEVLCSRIAIMSKGNLRCIGTNTHLKQRFGEGYGVSINYAPEEEEKAAALITELLPSAVAESEMPGTRLYRVQEVDMMKNNGLSGFFKAMIDGRGKENGIRDYSVSQSSLDEVFVRIAKEAEADEAT